MIKIPQLLFMTVAPIALMALFSVYGRGAWAWDVLNAITGRTGDASDDVVWSNVAYPLAAFAAWYDYEMMCVVWATGVFLAVGSAAYHSTYERWAQRFDVAAMMTYLSSVLAAVLSVWTVWAWAIVPLAAAAYSYWTWEIDSQVHVPVWAVVTVGFLVAQVGAVGLVSLAPVAVGLGIDQLVGGGHSDRWTHSAWHFGSAASVATVLYLI